VQFALPHPPRDAAVFRRGSFGRACRAQHDARYAPQWPLTSRALRLRKPHSTSRPLTFSVARRRLPGGSMSLELTLAPPLSRATARIRRARPALRLPCLRAIATTDQNAFRRFNPRSRERVR
jgi:hypothetical protein